MYQLNLCPLKYMWAILKPVIMQKSIKLKIQMYTIHCNQHMRKQLRVQTEVLKIHSTVFIKWFQWHLQRLTLSLLPFHTSESFRCRPTQCCQRQRRPYGYLTQPSTNRSHPPHIVLSNPWMPLHSISKALQLLENGSLNQYVQPTCPAIVLGLEMQRWIRHSFQHKNPGPAHSRYSINNCRMDGWITEWASSQSTAVLSKRNVMQHNASHKEKAHT